MAISKKERRLMIAEEVLQNAEKEMNLFITKQLEATAAHLLTLTRKLAYENNLKMQKRNTWKLKRI